MPNDMLTQAIANLEAIAAEMRESPYWSADKATIQCWADKVLTAVSDLREVEVPSTEPDGLVRHPYDDTPGSEYFTRVDCRHSDRDGIMCLVCALAVVAALDKRLQAQADALSAAQRSEPTLATDCEEAGDERCGECAECRKGMWLHELEKRRALETALSAAQTSLLRARGWSFDGHSMFSKPGVDADMSAAIVIEFGSSVADALSERSAEGVDIVGTSTARVEEMEHQIAYWQQRAERAEAALRP